MEGKAKESFDQSSVTRSHRSVDPRVTTSLVFSRYAQNRGSRDIPSKRSTCNRASDGPKPGGSEDSVGLEAVRYLDLTTVHVNCNGLVML